MSNYSWSPPGSSTGGAVGEVKLLVGTGLDQETFTCDKRTLVSLSPHFARMVSGNANTELPEWIMLPDDDPVSFQNILKCIKDPEASPPTKNCVATYLLARKLEIPGIAKTYRSILIQCLEGLDMAVEVYETARRLKDDNLRDLAIEYIIPRANSFFKSEVFNKLSYDGVTKMLDNDTIVVDSEFDVFRACLNWAKTECKRKQLDPENFLTLKNVLRDICFLIRFPVIPQEIFMAHIETLGILERHDCQLLHHYWALRKNDPISAEAMDLPFKKEKRTGTIYSADFFKRKRLNGPGGVWTVPPNQVVSLRIWGNCSIKLRSILLFGKPANGKKTGYVSVKLLEKTLSSNYGGGYSTVASQTAIIFLSKENITTVEFNPPLKLTAGNKHQLDLRFIDNGFEDKSMGTQRGSHWKKARVAIKQNNFCDISLKKVEGQDCLFHTLNFTVAYLLTSLGLEIVWSSTKPPGSDECVVC